jgi:hypothetical protein
MILTNTYISWDTIGNKEFSIVVQSIKIVGTSSKSDRFEVSLKLVNGSRDVLNLTNFRIEHKMLNQLEWKDVNATSVNWGYYQCPLPMFLGSTEVVELGFTVNVDFDAPVDKSGGNQSYLARFKPLRFRVRLSFFSFQKVSVELTFSFVWSVFV